MRNDFESHLPLVWQLELALGTAATIVSGIVVFVLCALFQHVANQALEAMSSMQAGATPSHLSIGSLWPVVLGLLVVMSVCLYYAFRRAYTNLLIKFQS